MNTADVLRDAFDRVRGVVHGVLDGVTTEQLEARVGPEATSITPAKPRSCAGSLRAQRALEIVAARFERRDDLLLLVGLRDDLGTVLGLERAPGVVVERRAQLLHGLAQPFDLALDLVEL